MFLANQTKTTIHSCNLLTKKLLLTDVLVPVLRGLPDPVQARLVTLVIAVGEVEPRDVHSRLDESLEGGNVPARRSHGAYDLRLARRDVARGHDGGKGDVRPAQLGSAGGCLGLHDIFLVGFRFVVVGLGGSGCS